MILHEDHGYGIRWQGHDALGREFSLTHFAGHEMMTLGIYSPVKHLHLNRHDAAQMARVLDHYARHEQLPNHHASSLEDWCI